VLSELQIYHYGVATRFSMPGEKRAPAISDLEQPFLVSRGVVLTAL
jgi:hypothetical protein